MTLYIYSDDPNDAPGIEPVPEPLSVMQAGGQEFDDPIPDAHVPVTFDVTVDHALFEAWIAGGDADESAVVDYCVNGPETYSTDIKDGLNEAAETLDQTFGALDAVCSGLPEGPGLCEVADGLAGSLIKAATWGVSKVTEDPVDTDYKRIAVPASPHLSPVQAGNGVPPLLARAVNELDAESWRVRWNAEALYATLNKASGAAAAGDQYWIGRQQLAAAMYSREMGVALGNLPGLLGQMRDALITGGFPSSTLSASQAHDWQAGIASNGIPDNVRQTLVSLGATDDDIKGITARMIVSDPSRMAGTFPDKLASPDLLAALRQAAQKAQSFEAFSGFVSPAAGHTYKVGDVIPVAFHLFDGSPRIVTNESAKLRVGQVQGDGTINWMDAAPAQGANADGTFAVGNTGAYVFNLATGSYPAGTYVLRAGLSDGTSYGIEITLQ